MKKRISSYYFDKISTNMAKKFGRIKPGNEGEYEPILLAMESNLIKTNRLQEINNSRRVIEAIKICLFIVDGYLSQEEYDFDEYLADDNKPFVHALLMSFDPFTNGELRKEAEKRYDLESADGLLEYFMIYVKCLLRIEKSAELWLKEFGINGYFRFMENQVGSRIPHDDKMNFTLGVGGVDTTNA